MAGKKNKHKPHKAAQVAPTTLAPVQANADEMKPHEKLKFYLEVLGIIGGLIGVLFLVLQYKEMVRATNAAADAVNVARDQMKEMKRQNDDTEAQQRPRLLLETFDLIYKTNDHCYELSTCVKNIGTISAFELVYLSEMKPTFEIVSTTNKPDFHRRTTLSYNTLPVLEPREVFTNVTTYYSKERESMRVDFKLGYSDYIGRPYLIDKHIIYAGQVSDSTNINDKKEYSYEF